VQKQVTGGSEMRGGMCDKGFPGHSQGRKPHWHTNRKQQCSWHNKNLDTHTHTLPVSTKLLVAWKHFGTQSRMETHFNFTKTVCNLRNLSTYLTIEASVHEGICQIISSSTLSAWMDY